MMDDRTLLEAAAKAAGYYFHGHRIGRDPAGRDYKNCYVSTTNDTDDWFVWSPLTDDGDALRLAVKLGIAIRHYLGDRVVYANDEEHFYDDSKFGGDCDPYAATRRAIVRAAAAIGGAKP
jgi:hypothetical protein